MSELQEKLLELLCEIDEICRKHGIEYCLFAGSGLGADRHGGFIPWDDDADIVMTLENYEKFLQVFDSEAKEGRVLNCLEKSIEYPFTYARYVDVTTTAVQKHTAFGGCDPGIKIDIFIVVPTHSDIRKAEQHKLEILAFSEVICTYGIMHNQRPEGFIEAYQAEKKLFDKMGREKYIKKRLQKLKYYKKKGTGKYVLLSGMMSNSYIIDADIVDNVVYVKFEDVELPISRENIELSKLLYGEGWISKPQKVETPRHTYLLDMSRPYIEYMDLLWKTYDFDESERTVATRKYMHMYERDQFKDVLINNQSLRNLAVEMSISNGYKKLSDEEKADYRSVYNLFEKYYAAQLKGINKHYGLFIDLAKETFIAAMSAAIMMDRYYEAADIMSIGFSSDAISRADKTFDDIKYGISICREITETMYIEKDLEKLQKIIRNIDDDPIKKSLTVKIAVLWIKAASAEYDELDRICDMVDQYSEIYGEIGELLTVKGFCLEKKGQKEVAANVYEKAANNIRNGYLFQWLANKGHSTYEYKYE